PEEPIEVVERNKEESLIRTSLSGPDPQIEPLPRSSQLLLSDGPTGLTDHLCGQSFLIPVASRLFCEALGLKQGQTLPREDKREAA
ncbi:unnamed protein product, partial [Timema podura]|nr:unnamed protein product [Timema podura]